MEKPEDRIIVLVDMDCFYVQVEQKLCPEYQNKPCAVVQYKTWKGGSIIAVNYEARARGVSRFHKGDEAVKICPDIHLFRVPEVRGKADLTKYRDAGARVLNVICEYSDCVERASIDEAYIDLTSVLTKKIQSAAPVTADQIPNTFVVGWENKDPDLRKKELQKWLQMIYEEDHLYNDRLLALAAVIIEEMRASIYENTGYRCSAGLAHNKMLAKLCCGINKPNKQTVLPQASIQIFFNSIPIKKVRNLGGKLGEEVVKKLNVEKMGDLFNIERSQFIHHFGEKTGHWLYNLARGIEHEPVIARQLPKSIGCGKNFPGKQSLATKDQVTHWLKQLALELEERLKKDRESNQRVAHLLTIGIRNHENNTFSMVSRSCPIHIYDAEKLAHDALLAISKLNNATSENLWRPSIWTLSMAASKFEDKLDNSHCSIQSYLVNNQSKSENIKLIENGTCERQKENQTNLISEDSKPTKLECSITSFFNKEMSPNSSGLAATTEENCREIGQSSVLDDCCSAIDSLEGVSNLNDRTKVSSSDACCSVTVPTNESKPKKGFFARKLEERLRKSSNVTLESKSNLALSENPANESAGTDLVPSTSAVQDNLSFDNQVPFTSGEHIEPPSSEDFLLQLDPELLKVCDKCRKNIPVWEEDEHLDYHMALDLSKEVSNSAISKSSSVKAASNVNKPKLTKKRKNTSKVSVQLKKNVQSNTLDAFFKKDS